MNSWEEKPEDRPTFTQQLKCLSAILALIAEYMDFNTISNPNAIDITPVSITTPTDDNTTSRTSNHDVNNVVKSPTCDESSSESKDAALYPFCNRISAYKDDDLEARTNEIPEKSKDFEIDSCIDEDCSYI